MIPLDRKYRIILSYPDWRGENLGIPQWKIEEIDLKRVDFGITRRFSCYSEIYEQYVDRLKKEMWFAMYKQLMATGFVPVNEELDLAKDDTITSDWNTIGLRVSAVFEGRIDQYIYRLTQQLKELDWDFAIYKRNVKSRGLLRTLKDWFLWKAREMLA